MKQFLDCHKDKITGTLSTFDRMIFKGHILPFFVKENRHYFLSHENILFKNFGLYAKGISESIKKNAISIAEKNGRPYIYLNSSRESKEGMATQIMKKDKIKDGLICILSCVEPCFAFDTRFNKDNKKLEIVSRQRKCMFIYFYYLDPKFGFMHVRIQTWFPFQIQIYINGREWLSKQLDRKGIDYKRYENSFLQIDDIKAAQKIADKLVNANIAKIFDSISKRINTMLPNVKKAFGNGYYWVLDQGEFATDVMFKNRKSLTGIYPELVEHSFLCCNASDVMKFLGRKLTGNFKGEIVTDIKRRPEGVRIRHRMKKNSIKMYDKWSVLRIETTINNPREFKLYREVLRKGEKVMRWVPMGKSVFNLYRYAEVSKASNYRYMESLSFVVPLNKSIKEIEQSAESIQDGSKSYTGFNPISKETTKIFEAVLSGSNHIHGVTNKAIQEHLFSDSLNDKDEAKKRSSKITRLIRKLRAHKFLAKVPRSNKYRVTTKGHRILGASIKLKKKYYPVEMKKAA